MGRAYEITHDTLVPPILKSRILREEAEAKEQQRLEREKEKRELRRARRNIAIAFVLVLIFVAIALFAYWQNRQVVATLEKVEIEQAKNEKIIDAFYFYKGRFALAYKDGKYGFINKEGDAVIDYQYEEAEQFDERLGYVKVKKEDKPEKKSRFEYDLEYGFDKKIENYLIDTTGTEYKVAYIIADLASDITAIDLREIHLDQFPRILFQHPQLQIIILDGNKDKKNAFNKIPKNIAQIKGLRVLSLEHSSITQLPKEIGDLKQLIYLNLSYNCNLLSLPEEIGQLKQLNYLNLSDNHELTSLPKEIGQLKQLTTLDLSWTKLSILPKEIGQLKQLTTLNLSRTNLPKETIQNLKKQLPNCEILH